MDPTNLAKTTQSDHRGNVKALFRAIDVPNRLVHSFVLADYLAVDVPLPYLAMVFDVIEHRRNFCRFLVLLRCKCLEVALHLQVYLSSISDFRVTPLLDVRHKFGHFQFDTHGLLWASMERTGCEEIEARFTRVFFTAPQPGIKLDPAGLFWRVVSSFICALEARLLGAKAYLRVR